MVYVFACFAVIIALCMVITAIPGNILGGIILFCLCLWGMAAGPWYIVLTSVLFMIGLVINIFGD
jgi:hypothetical protein